MVSPAVEKSVEEVSSPCNTQSIAWSGKFWRDSASKSSIVRNLSHGLARETADVVLTIAAARA
jgi:hypothetical protein